MATTATAPGLSDEQRVELFALIKGADSVELKLTVPVADRTRGAAELGVDPLDGQIRQVFFFDTPDLTLNKLGLVVRARRVQQKGDDSVVKLRPGRPGRAAEEAASLAELRCRGRRHARGVRLLGIDEAHARNDGRQGRHGREAGRAQALLQGAAVAVCSPRTRGLELDDLAILGPITVLKLKFAPEGIGAQARRRAVALPGQLDDPRAVDEVPAVGGVPGRRRDTGIPDPEGHRPHQRAGDQDKEGIGVLLQATRGRAALTPNPARHCSRTTNRG